MRYLALAITLCLPGLLQANAVSQLNSKLDYFYGSMEGHESHNLSASVATPLTNNIGLQFDALSTRVSDRDYYGFGTQGFWRDPNIGLLGISIATLHEDAIQSHHGGLNAELYHGPFTLGLQTGVARMKYDTGPFPFIDSDITRAYVGGSLDYYLLDDLRFGVGCDYIFDNTYATGQVEWQTPVPGLSLAAEFVTGEHDYDHALFGLRYYFGAKKKSLKLRHRQDDPANSLQPVLYGIGTYGAEYNQNLQQYIQNNGGSSGGYTGGSYGVTVLNLYGLSDTDQAIYSDPSD